MQAFANPDHLEKWWGPEGFSNTFERFEFYPVGHCIFTTHGVNGADYANESIFREIESPYRVVLEHVVKPWFRLTLILAEGGEGTLLTWIREFEGPGMAARVRPFSRTANEQNLDRLEAVIIAVNGS